MPENFAKSLFENEIAQLMIGDVFDIYLLNDKFIVIRRLNWEYMATQSTLQFAVDVAVNKLIGKS